MKKENLQEANEIQKAMEFLERMESSVNSFIEILGKERKSYSRIEMFLHRDETTSHHMAIKDLHVFPGELVRYLASILSSIAVTRKKYEERIEEL